MKKKGHISIFEFSVMLCMSIIGIYIYIGFFYPDPRPARPFFKLVSLVIQIGYPIIFFAIYYIYFKVRSGRIPLSSILLSGTTIIVMIFLGYPILLYFYNSLFFKDDIALFHPYLQLRPNDYIERPLPKDVKPSLNIMCLGGSTTEFKDKNGNGWPHYLELLLEEGFPNKHFEVHNLGRRWYTTMHTLINYSINLRHHKPDIIIVMHAINDILQNADFSYFSFDTFHEDYRHFYGPIYRLINRPTFYDSLKLLMKRLWYHRSREVVDTDYFPGTRSFERNIKTLIDLAKIDGVQVILMTQPNLLKDSMTKEELSKLRMVNYEAVGPDKKWNAATAKRAFEQYNNIIRDIALKDKAVYLIDLESVIPKTTGYFWDDVHYQDGVFKIIAAHIFEQMKQNNSKLISDKINP